MSKLEKMLDKILRGRSDANFDFGEVCILLRSLGFFERQKTGSHHIFFQAGIEEIINLQPLAGGMAKAYQVRQVRGIIVRYHLGSDDD